MGTSHQYVFISYSSRNYEDARKLKNYLNINNIDCWMAPHSIPAGSDYASEIPQAIGGCSAFLLLLSEEAQASNWVPKELDLAITRGRRIIPFQIDACTLSDPFEFRLTNIQRIEASSRYEEAVRELLLQLYQLLGIQQDTSRNQSSAVTNTIGEIRPGRIIAGKYRILRIIGRGGLSEVFLAENIATNMHWAIKRISKAPENKNKYNIFTQLLKREMQVLSKLKHVNIPNIVDVIEDSHVLLVVMEYIEGTTLMSYVQQHGPVEESKVIDWALQLCSALAYMHSQEPTIIYNDLRPSNIMLKPNGQIVLIDFGTAFECTDGNKKDRAVLGTRGYASPEHFTGTTDQRSDIYSMGVTLYHLLTGSSPSDPPYGIYPIRQFDPQLSLGMEYIIEKCTKLDPNDRYQSVPDVLVDLGRIDDLSARLKRKALFRNFFRFGK